MIGDDARALISDSPLGSRVVVRYRLLDGATDAIGYLLEVTATTCLLDTKRGEILVNLHEVIAARHVPEPPQPRHRNMNVPH